MAYKKLIKVSNVCQLLDKRKYNPSQTINGVTFTNNGDGTITANGTASDSNNATYRLDTFYIKSNRTYLMKGCPTGGSASKYFIMDGYRAAFTDLGSGIIKTISGSDDTVLCSPVIFIIKGTTVSNLVFKPQLFDLTEMYRAGNEPTTVEQFRQDFPEEMYDYSPHCWLTSYKKTIICNTKNLFDINTSISGVRIATSTGSTYPSSNYSVSDYINIKPNRQYIVNTNYNSYYSFYDSNKTYIVGDSFGNGRSIFSPANAQYIRFDFKTGENIRLTEGDFTYGLTAYRRNLTCKTKNLFDKSLVRSEEIANGSILEKGSNYFIVQGNISASPGTALYPNGWFRPLYNYNSPNSIYLKAGDIITISADYTVLENNSVSGYLSEANIYLYGAKNLANQLSRLPPVGVKTRRSITYTIPDGGDGYYYLVFTLNSSKIKIENIQLELGSTATDYVPYGHL